MKRIIATIAGASAVVAAMLGLSGSTALASTAPRCTNLSMSMSSPPQIGLGNWGWTVRLHNGTTSTCTLYGYALLQPQDGNHNALSGISVHHGPTYFHSDPGPSVRTLQPGENAHFYISLRNVQNSNPRATYLHAWQTSLWHDTDTIPDGPVYVQGGDVYETAIDFGQG